MCVYGQSDIVNDTLLSAAQAQLDLLTGSSFHTRTIIRRCECKGEITLRGEAYQSSTITWKTADQAARHLPTAGGFGFSARGGDCGTHDIPIGAAYHDAIASASGAPSDVIVRFADK